MERQWRWFTAAVGVAVAAYTAVVVCLLLDQHGFLSLFAPHLTPPTPPLLENASTTAGKWQGMGCPRRRGDPSPEAMPDSRSPEVENRLARQFPPGTSEARLKAALVSQHFDLIDACEADASIRRATFSQTGGRYYGQSAIWAFVAWKTNADGKILWTKADVDHTLQ